MADEKQAKKTAETPAPNEDQKGITASKGRPTPSRRQMEEEAEVVQGNFIQRTVAGLREYFAGVLPIDSPVWDRVDSNREVCL